MQIFFKQNKRNIFLISVLFFLIPNLYIIPGIYNQFFTTQSFSRLILTGLFFCELSNQKIKALNNPRIRLSILFFLLFFISQSITILVAIDIPAFLIAYEKLILGYISFTLFFVYYAQYKKQILNVFLISLFINILYQLILLSKTQGIIDFLSIVINQKHFDLVKAKIIFQNKIYSDTYIEIFIPIIIMKTFKKKKLVKNSIIILIYLISLLSNVRTRILMFIFALISSLVLFSKKFLPNLLIFLLIPFFIIIRIGLTLFPNVSTYPIFNLKEIDILKHTFNFRVEQIRFSINIAKNNFLGVGYGNFYDYVNKKILYYPNLSKDQQILNLGSIQLIHNNFAQILAEAGFLGFLIYIILILNFIKQDVFLLKKKRRVRSYIIISFWTLFIYGLFNPTTVGSYQFLFWGIRGIILSFLKD